MTKEEFFKEVFNCKPEKFDVKSPANVALLLYLGVNTS